MSASEYTTAGLERRGRGVILAVVIALAVIGYVVGLRAGVPDGPPGLADVPRNAEYLAQFELD